MIIPTGGAGLIIPGLSVRQAGLGAFPQSRYSLSFAAASSQYVSVPSSAALNFGSGDFTLACWINPASISGYRVLIGKDTDTARQWIFGFGGVTSKRLEFIDGPSPAVVGASVDLSTGTWGHVAVVRSTGVVTLYVNSTAVGSGTVSTTYSTASAVNFGRRAYPGFPQYYDGNLDDVRMYTRALSGAEIATLYVGGNPDTIFLAGWWRFEEGTGTTAADSSGNNNTGTLVNGPTWSTDVPSQLAA